MADTAVLVPGMLCDSGLWAGVESRLELPVVHAELDRPSVTGMAEHVLSSVDGRFVLVGLSLGAIVGFEIARLAPERVAGFAALATNAAAPRPEQHEGWGQAARRTEAGEFAAVVEEILPTMYAGQRPSPELAREFREMAERVGPRRFRTQLAGQSTRTDARAVLRTINAPSLVACGAEDALCPPRIHREIADHLSDTELHVVPGAGHLFPLEAPETTAGLLNGLIRRCTSPILTEENDFARSVEAPGAAADGDR